MLSNEGQAATVVQLVNAQSAANTAAATSPWVDIRGYEGDIVIIINPGAITGSCTPSIEDATDGAGTGAAAIAANEGAYVALVANTPRRYTLPAGAARGFLRFVGTVVTGPALIGVTLLARPKYS